MPKTAKGHEVMDSFMETYKSKKKAKKVAYAKANKEGKGSHIYKALHGG